MIKRLIVANWKMNPPSLEEARELSSRIEHGLLTMDRTKVEVVICPPFVFLPILRHLLHFIRLGVQDVSAEEMGSFTGQVSVRQIGEFNCHFVIIGHSERRALGEKGQLINRKIHAAIKHKLEPILCVGFGTKKSFTIAQIKRVVKKQLQEALKGVNFRKKNRLTIAYEPVWAISQGLGTGRAVSPGHAAKLIEYIKLEVPSARVIYGGSIDSKNAPSLAAQKVIEGGLVGGASLHFSEFIAIIKAFSQS